MHPLVAALGRKEPPKLSRARKRAYVKAGGSACPFCGTDSIEGEAYEHGEGFISQRVDCRECGRYWFDEFTLSGIVEGVEPCPKT